MVVMEPGVGQGSRQNHWQSTMLMASRSEEDDSSCSSSNDPSFGSYQDGRRKRKAHGDDNVEDVEVKRRKNREAAKRCRDKKLRQTEDLKSKNGDLEKENCQLAKQRDELIRKCRDYQREIDQHKQQGCVVPHFNPPYNLDDLLQPSSPGSPTCSEQAHSTSSCTSPAPSISPGPPTRYPPPSSTADTPRMPHQESLSSGGFRTHAQDMPMGSTSKLSMPASTPRETTQSTENSGQVHYLRVKTKDGSYKILCLDHENYKKVMQKLENNRSAAGNHLQSDPPQSSAYPSASASSDPANHQTTVPPEQSDLQTRMNEDMANNHNLSHQVEEQEANPSSGQKLDTCEDLISILKGHVKGGDKGIELTPVNEDEVPIKQEPLDAEYEHDVLVNQAGTTGLKQETVVVSGGPWISTGQQIRSSLDTLANQDHLSSHNTQIQNIVQYLAADEHAVTGASTIPRTGQAVMQKQATYSAPKAPVQMATYITSSAPVGALSKSPIHPSSRQQQRNTVSPSNQASLQQHTGVQLMSAQQYQRVASPAQTVTFGPRVTSSKNSAFAQLPGRPQTTLTTHANNTNQGIPRMSVSETSRAEAASISSQPEREIHPINGSAGSSGIGRTTQGGRVQLMPQQQQQQGIATSVSFQQDSALSFRDSLASTIDSSAIISLQLQESTSSEPLMTVSTSQIAEYLQKNSIEMMNIQ